MNFINASMNSVGGVLATDDEGNLWLSWRDQESKDYVPWVKLPEHPGRINKPQLTEKEWGRLEIDAWHKVVDQLVKLKAVTFEDCKSPVSKNETPGQRLFNSIRYWGEAKRHAV